jgi:hypothetical protein
MLGTFTAATTPTDLQAQPVIDDAVNATIAAAGVMPSLTDPNYALVTEAAATAAEWRAAADIEIAYPNRDADIRTYVSLDARAKDALATLLRVMVETQTGAVEAVPVWQAPAPPNWADLDPGSGIEPIYGQKGWA